MEGAKNYKRFQYSIEDLQAAVRAIPQGGYSATKASIQFQILKGTLINKLHGKSAVNVRKWVLQEY